ncbi:MAG: NTP transferase domain-containing protein [bacterium]|nr:NTP transferase domain-containing protein [bacterium]
MKKERIAAVVLAAGKGKRMNSPDKQKVTHDLAGRPMVAYTVETLKSVRFDQIIVVVGHLKEQVIKAVGGDVLFAHQDEPLGTGDALRVALFVIDPSIDVVLSLYGDDSAFLSKETLRFFIDAFSKSRADMACLTVVRDDPTGLGRIVRDSREHVVRIVEEKLASDEEKRIKEVNTGVYLFTRGMLDVYLPKIQRNETGEYFLTDIVELVINGGGAVLAHPLENTEEWFGVNSPEQLREADALKRGLS